MIESFQETKHASEEDLGRIATVDIENYHGLSLKTVLVFLSLTFIAFAQLLNLVGSGAFARSVAASVGDASQTVWLSQSITILGCVLGPPVSQAADYWGRKWFLVILTSFGIVGSIIISRANSMGMAIAGEAIFGVAYGSQPLLYAVASEILPRRYRPAAQGGINFALGMGGLTGLLGGSAIVKNYAEGFRIYWYINAAVLACAVLTCASLYNPPMRPLQISLTNKEKLGHLDWVGYFLLALGIVLFTIALSWAENPYPWTDPNVLALLIVGIAVLIGLAVHQTFFQKQGMFHHRLFAKDRNFTLALLCIFVDGMVFFAANGYYPFEVGFFFETDPIMVGVRFSALFYGSLVGSVAVALYSSITRRIREPIVAAFVLTDLFFIGMATNSASSSIGAWIYPLPLGFATGLGLTCLVTAAQISTPPELIAITSGLMISIRSLGGSIGLAIYNAIFNSTISQHVGPDIASAVIPLGLSPSSLPAFIGALSSGDTQALSAIPGVTPDIIQAGVGALQSAYLISFRNVWILGAVMSTVAGIASCFIINPGKDLNMHVDAPLEKED